MLHDWGFRITQTMKIIPMDLTVKTLAAKSSKSQKKMNKESWDLSQRGRRVASGRIRVVRESWSMRLALTFNCMNAFSKRTTTLITTLRKSSARWYQPAIEIILKIFKIKWISSSKNGKCYPSEGTTRIAGSTLITYSKHLISFKVVALLIMICKQAKTTKIIS